MYVGRALYGGWLEATKAPVLIYRISSRSFPDRTIVIGDGRADVVVVPGGNSESQYIQYQCAAWNETFCVATNGSHTPWIIDKLQRGKSPRDSLIEALYLTDFERDQRNTPRIAAIADRGRGDIYLGQVSIDGLCVWRVDPQCDGGSFISTYGDYSRPKFGAPVSIDARDAQEAAALGMGGGPFRDLTGGVATSAAVGSPAGWTTGSVSL